jgi:hypothetical protein
MPMGPANNIDRMQEVYVQQLNALNGALLNSNRSMQLVLADDINRTQQMYAQ